MSKLKTTSQNSKLIIKKIITRYPLPVTRCLKIFGIVSFLVFGLFFTVSSTLANTCLCAVGADEGGEEWRREGILCTEGVDRRECAEACGREGELVRAECIDETEGETNQCNCVGLNEAEEEVEWTVPDISCDEGPSEDCLVPCERTAAAGVSIEDEERLMCVPQGRGGSINPPSEVPPEEAETGTREAPSRDCDVVNHDCMSRFPGEKTAGKHIFFSNAECYCCGECTLDDFTNVFINVADYLFGILGALALMFFIYGGVTWLTAGGSAERVDKGRRILIGAVIGIAICVGAWFLIDLLQQALGVQGRFRL